jgi:hypothetical protein
MKLITETVDPNELIQLRILFESKGIPIFVSNEDAARNFGLIYPARKYGIFVLYEEQHADAVRLLEDDSHVVINAIDMDEHRAFMQSQRTASLKKLFRVIMITGGLVLASFVMLAIFLSSIYA